MRGAAVLVAALVLASAGRAVATDAGLVPSDGAPGEVAVTALDATGGTAPDPVARLRTARLRLAVPGSRVEWPRGRAVMIRRLVFGRRIMVIGYLRTEEGRAINDVPVEVRGQRGRVLGEARTDRGGSFSAWVRPDASGVLRVGIPIGRRLVPRRASHELRVRVRPRVPLHASTTAPRAGAPVVFTGSIHPSPRSVRGPARKVIALEWRDPIRGTWRPVVNARARADGTFRITWRFGLRGLTIPMRVRVLTEGDWPLLPALSREIPLTVR